VHLNRHLYDIRVSSERRVYGNLFSTRHSTTIYGAFTAGGTYASVTYQRRRNEAVKGCEVRAPWSCWGGEWSESIEITQGKVRSFHTGAGGEISFVVVFAPELGYSNLYVTWRELTGEVEVGDGRLQLMTDLAALEDSLRYSYAEVLLFFDVLVDAVRHELVFVRWLERASAAAALDVPDPEEGEEEGGEEGGEEEEEEEGGSTAKRRCRASSSADISGGEASGEEGEADSEINHTAACQVCEDDTETRRNQILVCASCTRGYHQLCLSPPLSRVPEEDWYCPRCPDPKKDDDASSAHSDDTDDVDANEGGGRDDVEDFADLCTSEAGVSAADIAAAGPPFDLPVYRYDPHH